MLKSKYFKFEIPKFEMLREQICVCLSFSENVWTGLEI